MKLVRIASRLDSLRDAASPTAVDAEDLMALWTDGACVSYFFRDDYRNPTWLESLVAVDAFRRYARVRSAYNKRFVIFRELAGYVHRVAKAEPQQVADVLVSLSTRDFWATGQLMSATLDLPDKLAANVVPRFVAWCGQTNSLARDEEVVALAQRMLASGFVPEFRLLLELLLSPVLSAGSHVRGRFFDDDIVQFVAEAGAYRGFCAQAPLDCLTVAEEALRKAIKLSQKAPSPFPLRTGRNPDPSSGIRSAIEGDPQNQHEDFEDGLVVAVRDALALYAQKSPQEAEKIIRRYLASQWSIFRRLALHALAEFTSRYPQLAQATAMRRVFFDDGPLHHEYWRLVPAVFDSLSDAERGRLLKWIGEGGGQDKGGRGWFAYRRLSMLKGCKGLPQASQHLLGSMEAEFGPVEQPGFLMYWSPGHWGAETVDCSGKTVDEIWQMMGEEPQRKEGTAPWDSACAPIARGLKAFIGANPKEGVALAAKAASALKAWMYEDSDGCRSEYAICLLQAYQEASREGKGFDWAELLGLCEACVPAGVSPEQWPDALPKSAEQRSEYDWSGARHSTIHLIEEGLRQNQLGLSRPDLRLRAMNLLLKLAEDPFPTPEYEAEREKLARQEGAAQGVDWHEVSINTNRPEAFDALMQYAIQRCNEVIRAETTGDRLEPEVRTVLTSAANDPCRSVHAALGAKLFILWWLDSQWATGTLERLLPTSAADADIWNAGWTAYLRYSRLNRDLHGLVTRHYRRSIGETAGKPEDDPHLVGLCRHLAAVYAWGWEELSDQDSLVRVFYSSAEDSAACELAQACEHFLREPEMRGREDAAQWSRLKDLLQWRTKGLADSPNQHVKELRAFARWFDDLVNSNLGDLPTLEDVLSVVTAVPLQSWDFRGIGKFLDAHAEAHPEIAARLLRQMFAKCGEDRDSWYWDRETVYSILDKAFASSDLKVRRHAANIVELLWKQGEWEPFVKHREHMS